MILIRKLHHCPTYKKLYLETITTAEDKLPNAVLLFWVLKSVGNVFGWFYYWCSVELEDCKLIHPKMYNGPLGTLNKLAFEVRVVYYP